jgi:hypothetical protein
MGIDGNETIGQLARHASSHPLVGPQPALGVPAEVARVVIRGWKSRIRAYLKELGSNST